jgi:hypothetical protein
VRSEKGREDSEVPNCEWGEGREVPNCDSEELVKRLKPTVSQSAVTTREKLQMRLTRNCDHSHQPSNF